MILPFSLDRDLSLFISLILRIVGVEGGKHLSTPCLGCDLSNLAHGDGSQ